MTANLLTFSKTSAQVSFFAFSHIWKLTGSEEQKSKA
jgi:hypothetical protein